jgi:tetraacyldisaccharide 4'-kinase
MTGLTASELAAPAPPRSPWQRFYGAIHALRYGWHRRRQQRLPRPVVSVGNLHWGGAGKTPLTAAIAAHLRDDGHRVAILSRGYRSRGSGVRLVSSWDEGPLMGPTTAGDEPVLLAGELPGVAVAVEADRAAAGRAALERLQPPPDLFLLDDGFSHLRLARDLDLLAFPTADPFAGGRLPPAGRLREPLAAVGRAHAALLTGEGATPAAAQRLALSLVQHGFRGRGFAAPTVAAPPRSADGRPMPAGGRWLLVTAIARPGSFRATAEAVAARATAEGHGFTVVDLLAFPDHHAYPEPSLARIRDRVHAVKAHGVLTTSKDRVKLLGRLDLPLAEIPIRAQPEPAFWRWLDERLDALSTGEIAASGAPEPDQEGAR